MAARLRAAGRKVASTGEGRGSPTRGICVIDAVATTTVFVAAFVGGVQRVMAATRARMCANAISPIGGTNVDVNGDMMRTKTSAMR